MPNLDLVARFFGVDAGAGAEFDRLGAKSTAAGASMAKFAKYSGVALAAVAVGSIKAAADYQKLTVNLVTGAGEQQKNLKMVSSGMLSMAGQVGDSASTLAKAMFTVESAGFHGAAALGVLKTAAEGAKVDNADLTTVVDALTSAMNAYHEPTANAAKVTNTLIASAAVGKMHLQDLAGSLGTVLPSAAALRVPLDQVGAAMATMTMQGTDANRAATYLRFAFAALANPTSKAQKAMQDVGLTSAKVANTMTHGGLPQVFALLQDAVGRKFPAGSAKYLASLANMVGGTRGLQAVLELTGKNLTTMQANLGSIDGRVKSAGNSVSDWSEIQKNFNQQLAEFGAGLQADAIRLGQMLLPAAADLIHVLSGGIHVIGDITRFFEDNRVAADALATVLGAALIPKVAETVVWLGRTIELNAAAAFLALRGAVVAAAEAFTAAEGGIAGASAALGAMNPMMLAIAAAGVLIARSWESQRKAQQAAQQAAKDYFASLDVQTNSLGSLSSGIDALTARINTLTGVSQSTKQVLAATYFQPGVKILQTDLVSLVATQTKVRSNVDQLSHALGVNRNVIMSAAAAIGAHMTDAYSTLLPQIQSYIATAKLSHEPTKQAAAAFQDLGNKANSVTDDINNLDTAWSDLVGNFVGLKVAKAQAVDALVSLDQALKKSHGSLSDNTAAGRAAVEQLGSTTGSLNQFADSVYKQTGSYTATKNAMQSMVDRLTSELPKGSKVAQQVTSDIAKYLHHLAAKAGSDGAAIGSDFGAGLVGALKDSRLVGSVRTAASDLGGVMIQGTRDRIVARSPSKEAIKTGQWYAQGLAIGMDSKGHEIYVSGAQAARQLAMGLTEGFTGESVKVKDSFSETMQSVLSKVSAQISAALTKQRGLLKTYRQQLHSDLSSRQSAIVSLQGSISGNADISNVLNQTTPAGVAFTANIGSYLGSQASLLKREAGMFAKLRKMGLSPRLLAQISAMAPTDAIAIMTQITSGQDGSVSSLNALESQIQASSKAIASGTVNTPHELALLKGDRQQINRQTELLDKIERHLAHFREHPQQAAQIHIALHELGFTDAEIKKIMARINKITRESGGLVKVG